MKAPLILGLAFAALASSCASHPGEPPSASASHSPPAQPPATGPDQRALQVVPLQHAAAAQLADTLNDVFRKTSVYVVADQRTNSIIVQAAVEDMQRVLDLAGRLDKKTE